MARAPCAGDAAIAARSIGAGPRRRQIAARRASRARLLQALDVFADEISRDPVDELDAPLNVDAAPTRTRAPVARCCCCLGWLFPKPVAPSPAEVELPEWRPRKPKYAKVATTPSAGGFAIADDGSDSD